MAITSDSASYYMEATLQALVDGIKVYSSPGGKLLRTVNKNSIVGKIMSYVVSGDDVWWELYEGGFVKHGKGLFNPTLAKSSSEGADYDMKEALLKGSSLNSIDFDLFGSAFKKLPGIVLLVGGGLLLLWLFSFFRRL